MGEQGVRTPRARTLQSFGFVRAEVVGSRSSDGPFTPSSRGHMRVRGRRGLAPQVQEMDTRGDGNGSVEKRGEGTSLGGQGGSLQLDRDALGVVPMDQEQIEPLGSSFNEDEVFDDMG